jgi:hypothetical protein
VTSSLGEVEVEAGKETFTQKRKKPQAPTNANQQNIFKIDQAIGIHHATATEEEKMLIEKSEGGLIQPALQTDNVTIEETVSIEESANVEETVKDEVTEHETTDEIKNTIPTLPVHNPCPTPQ